MLKDELILEFNAEWPQLIIGRKNPENKTIKILNVIRGMEALTMYERLAGKDKITFDKELEVK